MYGHKFINKYYKRDRSQSRIRSSRNPGSVFLAHQKGNTTANVINTQDTEYLYIYSVEGRDLNGILFHDRTISLSGFSVEYFPEEYEEITKEEFDKVMKLIINKFYFEEIFGL